MLHMEGDVDGSISLLGAWGWIKDRKFPTTKPWTPWIVGDQLIGNLKEYNHLTFVTIHGYGHGAYFQKAAEVSDLLVKFLNNSIFA